MINFCINLSLAHRLLPCVSTEETRYYLNGVGVDPCSSGARLAATDGHVLGCFRDHDAHGEFGETVPIVSRGAIADAFKAAKKAARLNDKAHYWLIVEGATIPNALGRVVLAPTATSAMSGREGERECPVLWRSAGAVLIDGSFPDYKRVIPSEGFAIVRPKANTSPISWNPELLGRFSAIVNPDPKAKAKGLTMISGCVEGDGPWLLLCAGLPEFVGVAMPMRGGAHADLMASARDMLDRSETFKMVDA